jgi:hypothetical protein
MPENGWAIESKKFQKICPALNCLKSGWFFKPRMDMKAWGGLGFKGSEFRVSSRKGIWIMGIFRWQHRQAGEFFNWLGAAAPPYQTGVTVDDRHQGPHRGP